MPVIKDKGILEDSETSVGLELYKFRSSSTVEVM